MSISNRHPVNPFIAGSSEAMSDQRLAKVGYKSTKKTPAKFKSVCASVPAIAELAPEQIQKLLPFICDMLESAQDGIFRSLYESADGMLEVLTDDDISVDACISYLSAEKSGDRLNKEMLERWFDEQMLDNLTVVIAEKLGFDLSTPDQLVTIGKHTNAYRGMISALSGGKTMYAANQIQGLKKALEVSSVDDEIGKKLMARLVQMESKPKMEELLDLA